MVNEIQLTLEQEQHQHILSNSHLNIYISYGMAEYYWSTGGQGGPLVAHGCHCPALDSSYAKPGPEVNRITFVDCSTEYVGQEARDMHKLYRSVSTFDQHAYDLKHQN